MPLLHYYLVDGQDPVHLLPHELEEIYHESEVGVDYFTHGDSHHYQNEHGLFYEQNDHGLFFADNNFNPHYDDSHYWSEYEHSNAIRTVGDAVKDFCMKWECEVA